MCRSSTDAGVRCGAGTACGRLTLAELLARKANLTTRKLLASGLDDYVSDGVPGHHSPFVGGLLEKLRSYGGADGYITAAALLNIARKCEARPGHGRIGKIQTGQRFSLPSHPHKLAQLTNHRSRLDINAVAHCFDAGVAAAIAAVVQTFRQENRRTIAGAAFRNLEQECPTNIFASVLIMIAGQAQRRSNLAGVGPALHRRAGGARSAVGQAGCTDAGTTRVGC